MKQYVTLDKRSKKAQREYYAKQRTTWGELNPVTRSVPSGKAYNRKKEKQRIGVEFRNGFDADFLRSLVLFIHFRTKLMKVLRFVIAKQIAFRQELRYTIYKRRWSR